MRRDRAIRTLHVIYLGFAIAACQHPLRAQASPQAVGVTPSSGSGLNQTMLFTFSDSQGWQNLDVVNILINNVLDGRSACYLAYSRPQKVLYLVADDGSGLSGMSLDGRGLVSNSQCTVNGLGSTATGRDATLSLVLNLTFTAGFAGNKVVYLAARDLAGGNSGWQALGTRNVTGITPPGPSVSGMSPSRMKTLNQSYTFSYTDTQGWQDLSVVNVLVNSAIDGRGACYVAFVPSGPYGGSVYLVDDAGDAAGPYSGLTLPGTGVATNHQCSISGSESSVSASGTTLTLTLSISFSPSFTGNQVFYLAARSNSFNSGWQAAGAVGVQ